MALLDHDEPGHFRFLLQIQNWVILKIGWQWERELKEYNEATKQKGRSYKDEAEAVRMRRKRLIRE